MSKKICRICKSIIRRPVDHIDCPGIISKSVITKYKPNISTTEITQEIKIPFNLF